MAAETLYEAVGLALAELVRCGFTDAAAGPGTTLTVAVKLPTTPHTIKVSRFREWLEGGAENPKERVLKNRLKELAGG